MLRMAACTGACVCLYACVWLRICVHMCVLICVSVCVRMCVYVCFCAYVWLLYGCFYVCLWLRQSCVRPRASGYVRGVSAYVTLAAPVCVEVAFQSESVSECISEAGLLYM